MKLETETINKLFLGLSQVTNAKTKRELELEKQLNLWQKYASYCFSCAQSGESNVQGMVEFQDYLQRIEKEKGNCKNG